MLNFKIIKSKSKSTNKLTSRRTFIKDNRPYIIYNNKELPVTFSNTTGIFNIWSLPDNNAVPNNTKSKLSIEKYYKKYKYIAPHWSFIPIGKVVKGTIKNNEFIINLNQLL